MKVLICLAVVAVIACVNGFPSDDDVLKKIEEQRKKAEENVGVCVKELGVDPEVAKKLTFGDFSVRDEKAQCFVHCFFKHSGFMNEKDEPEKEVLIAKLSEKTGIKNEKLEELIGKCVAERGGDKCETSFKIYECYWNNRGLPKNIPVATQ